MKVCQRCNTKIKSLSPLRKWCVDCRKKVNFEYVQERRREARITR